MQDRVGQQLGNYRLIRLLGRGGFAEVYLGEHVRLDTPAAVKVLYTRLAAVDDVESFQKEARTIAHLRHPNIVRVFDFDVVNDTPFLVMDYASKGTLRQRYPKGTVLPTMLIIRYVKQVADALQYAHDQRLIHRDIKPENMLVGERDELLLSDFGIAIVAQSSRYQGTQDMAGTIAYMAPEQIQAHPRPASDQYALGVVVYEWLSGNRPFHGSYSEIAVKHTIVPPPSMRERIPTVSPFIEQVVMTALAKDPRDRFASVQAFATALEQAAQSDQPTFVTPPRLLQAEQAGPPPQSSIFPVQAGGPSPLPPTQFAQPSPSAEKQPPVPPTQLVKPSPSLEENRLETSGSHSISGVKAESELSNEKSTAIQKRDEQVKVWGIRKRQVVAMIIGTLLFGILSPLTILPPGYPLIIFLPAIVVLLFFGAVYGPWVGLVVGGVGSFISYFIILNHIETYLNVGNFYIGFGYYYSYYYLFGYLGILFSALTGFTAGLAVLITKGRYNKIRPIAIADVIGGAGAGLFVSLGLLWGRWVFIAYFSQSDLFTRITLPTVLFGLLLLPILLLIYNRIASRSKRA
jgi:serine/threonine protein kinase